MASPPPPYEDVGYQDHGPYLATRGDPRTSSMQSLLPETEVNDSRRTLLLIYIHGFMGNETSFRSFPAHVHNLVTILLAQTHVVHTKLYPRYKSRRAMDFVANDFSDWLTPHESPNTDVILLGHSMGGLLSTEVVLLTPRPPPGGQAFRHRTLGTINFDVPFLGMHPGVVTSGLSSIFKPSASPPVSPIVEAEASASATSVATTNSSSNAGRPPRHDTLFEPPTDPNFNPKFSNDINIPIRKGWRSTMHFINKHSDSLRTATKQYVKSHLEFGGAMADYRALHARYNKIRALEENEESLRRKGVQRTDVSGRVPRVRFVNYYTACSGRPKKAKDADHLAVKDSDSRSLSASSRSSLELSRTPSPRISVEEVRDGDVVPMPLMEAPSPIECKQESNNAVDELSRTTTDDFLDSPTVDKLLASAGHIQMPIWPPLPPEPSEPAKLDLSLYSDKSVQEALKREHERQMKAYKQAMKDRESTLADRKRAEDKIRKVAAKEVLKKQKAGPKQSIEPKNDKKENGGVSRSTTQSDSIAPFSPTDSTTSHATSNTESATSSSPAAAKSKQTKPPKDRKFCVLPPKNEAGERDPCWVRVFMEGVDEVGAHCGLFFLNATYERLVGEVGSKIEEWVQDRKY